MNDIAIRGAEVYGEAFGIPITSTIVNMWIVIAIIFLICVILTRNLKTKDISKRQAVAEAIVKMITKFTTNNMGVEYASFTPFVAAVFVLSTLCSLCSIFGLYPPTSDLSVTLGWGLLVFVMITYTKIKTNRVSGYLKSFIKPIPVLMPFNIISEVSTPISMALRHFGSVATGSVIMTLLNAAMAALSGFVLGWLPSPIKGFPMFQAGIPALASLYFDLFSSFLQAYIFCMLTTIYIKIAAEKQ